MRTAYSYLRFSTPEQAAGDSFDRQTEITRRYLVAHPDLRLDDKLTLRDLGVSSFRGQNMKEGALGLFLKAAEKGLVDEGSVLLVESLDRISRQTARKALRTLESIVEAGVTVVTLCDNREYSVENLDSDPMSLIMSILIFIRANEESERKSERLAAAWTRKRTRAQTGEKLTGRCPAWLSLVDGAFVVHEDRAAIVRWIFEMVAAGNGLNTIAKTMNTEEIPLFGRGSKRSWNTGYLHKLTNFQAVIGIHVPRAVDYSSGSRKFTALEPIPNYYPSIVSLELWDAVQGLKRSRSPARGRHREIRNLFGGLARCIRCGRTVTCKHSGRQGTRYLICQSARMGGGCKPYTSVDYQAAETLFLRHAPYLIENAPAGADFDDEIRSTETVIAGTEEEIDTLLVQLGRSTGALRARVQGRLDQAGAELDGYRTELDRLTKVADDSQGRLVQRRLSDLKGLLQAPVNVADANAALRQALTEITVDYGAQELVLKWRHGGESRCPYVLAGEFEAVGQKPVGVAAANARKRTKRA